MTRTSAFAHACLASGGWLLPWLSMLLVSVSLATAMSLAVSHSLAASDGGPAQGAAVVQEDAAPPQQSHPYYQFAPNSYCSIMLPRWCAADVDAVP
jgi:hypothetical protein